MSSNALYESQTGWVVVDGDHTVVDGPFPTQHEAHTAETTHLDAQDSDEHYETYVAHQELCDCVDNPKHLDCFYCYRGVVVTEQQPWRNNQPEERLRATTI